VLYEILCGRAPFAGDTISDTIGAILHREPDWSRLPPSTPPGVQRLLRRCLQKDIRQRLRDIGDARIELADALGSDNDAMPPVDRRAAPPFPWVPWALAAALAAAAGIAAWSWAALEKGDEGPAPVTRTTIALAADQQLDTLESASPLAISPDGRRLVYVARAGQRAQLFLRSLDSFDAAPIPGTDGARYPFFSPDGQSVAFFAGGKLKRVSIQGGSPVSICDVPVVGRGGAWGRDGTIVFDPGASGLMRVQASGGQPEQLRTGDPQMDRSDLSWPQLLPDGMTLLATVGNSADAPLAALSLRTGTWQRLGIGSQAQYLPSGHLLFHAPDVRQGELRVAAFDQSSLSLAGSPVAVLDGVFRSENGGGAYFAVARNGTIVFVRGGHARTLVRVDRNGRRTALLAERRGYRMPAISPDGRLLGVTIDPRPSQVWVFDVARQSGVPLAGEGHSIGSVWTNDGRRVAYTSRGEIYARAADASGPAEPLLPREGPQYPQDWSIDGRTLLFLNDTVASRSDIWIKTGDDEPRPLIATAAIENAARLSPDNRWLAYMSDESGRPEIYVRPFPDVDAGKWLVSTDGGVFAVWSPSGKELFYMNGTTMMAVAIEARGTSLSIGRPEALFSGPFETGSPQFDVMPDGRHFIMVEADPDARPTQIHVILNWMEEVKRAVGSRQ
jgi:serine/threonine-protein kinase